MSHDILLSEVDADPNQPRKHFDPVALDDLAQSIAANGLAVPLLVRPVGDRFVIVHGERRYKAVQSLEWETILADVREMSEEEARLLSLIENVQRADLSPIEEANAYKAYLDTGMTQKELGRQVGKSQSYVATKIRLLNLPDEIQSGIDDGRITEGHAKQLLRIDSASIQDQAYQYIAENALTVSQTKDAIDGAVSFLTATELQRAENRIETMALTTVTEVGVCLAELRKRLDDAEFAESLNRIDIAPDMADLMITLSRLTQLTVRGEFIYARHAYILGGMARRELDMTNDIELVVGISRRALEAQNEIAENNLRFQRVLGQLVPYVT